MDQATLSFPTFTAAPTEPADRIAFDIGWDHAHHGLVPPAELLHPGTPVLQGWMAGKAVFGRRTLATSRATRQWLALRLLAWRRGIHFETQQLNAHHFAQIHTDRCPIRCSARPQRTPGTGWMSWPPCDRPEHRNPVRRRQPGWTPAPGGGWRCCARSPRHCLFRKPHACHWR